MFTYHPLHTLQWLVLNGMMCAPYKTAWEWLKHYNKGLKSCFQTCQIQFSWTSACVVISLIPTGLTLKPHGQKEINRRGLPSNQCSCFIGWELFGGKLMAYTILGSWSLDVYVEKVEKVYFKQNCCRSIFKRELQSSPKKHHPPIFPS